MTESERIEKTLNNIRDTAVANIADEKSQLQQYLTIARDENKSKAEREAALRRINELSPEYLGNLTLEKINTQEATAAVNKYVDSLLILEDIRQTQSKMNELRNQRETLMKNGPDNSFLDDVEAGAAKMLNDFKTSLGLYTDSWADNVLNNYVNKGVGQLRAIDKELSVLDKRIIDSRQKLIDLETKDKKEVEETGNDTNNGEGDGDKNKFVRAEADYYRRISDIKRQYLANDKMTQEEYNRQMREADMQLLRDKLKVKGLEPSEIQRINDQILDAEIKARDELRKLDEQSAKEEEKRHKELGEATYSRLEKEYQMRVEAATMYHYENKTSAEEYFNELFRLQDVYYNKVLNDTTVSEEKKKEIRKKMREQNFKEAKDEYDKELDEQKKIAQLYIDIAQDTGEALGAALADILTAQDDAMKNLWKNLLLTAINAIEQYLRLTYIKVLADSIIGLKFWKALPALAKIAAIEASFATVKGAISNFYTGGYTGPGDWDQPQGIVHSNEFVANRFAVANPNLRPIFDAIDVAQRTGNVGNLTADDVAAVAGSGRSSHTMPAITPVASAATTTNDPAMMAMLIECIRVLRKLKVRLDDPLVAETYVTGKRGVNQAQKEYDKLNNNKSRNKQ